MSYNIEEHEDYLKRQMPYDMEEGKWEAMQQRLKDKVLREETTAIPLRRRKPLLKIALGAAAGILLLFSVFIFVQQGKEQTGIPPKANPEQYLDKTISSLNEQELDWMHELNENDIPEQEEYFEN